MKIRYVVNRPAIVTGALLRVPRDAVDMEQVRMDLTVKNGVYWQTVNSGLPARRGQEAYIELYREQGEYVYVPRHYALPYLPGFSLSLEKVDTRDPRPRARDVQSRVRLRDSIQRDATSALLDDTGDKILSLGCGKGKTVVSLHAAAEGRRFPALVVVNTSALLGQWRERIAEHTNIPLSEVGHVQAGTERWRGLPVAVAMLHSLVQKQYDPEFYKYWRLAIFDEVHRLGAETFSQACSLFACERWGLTATHTRSDGMDRIIKMHMGRVAYENLEQPLKPEIIFAHTGVTTEITRFVRRGKVMLPQLMTWLAEHDTRNEFILKWINKAARSGRTVLVLGERLRQLSDLHAGCTAESKSIYVGAMSQEMRDKAIQRQVVFATQHLAKEGLDRPAFDTLMVLIPFGGEGRMQQSIGRIQREMAGKKPPVVVVFEDPIGIIGALGRKMRRWARLEEFTVTEVPFKREVT